jgi:hypothetical protein
MTFEGTVINGVVVLDPATQLPEGTRVDVKVREEAAPSEGATPTLLSLLKLAGTAPDLPEDFAAQHDHYLHGMPKR